MDIESWRRAHGWMLRDAARVFCPSEDARARLARYGLAGNAVVVPHEPVTQANWPLHPEPIGAPGESHRGGKKAKLRVALIGVLADRKGLATVEAAVMAAGDDIEFHLIGYPESDLQADLAERLHVTGAYAESDLPTLIAAVRPHVFWFPAQWPETYSYTLSAAIAAGGAIVAADIGAFPERLRGRPLSWFVPAAADSAACLNAFDAVRRALTRGAKRPPQARRPGVADYYAHTYLKPMIAPRKAPTRRPATAKRTRVLVIPERLDTGLPGPCAFIRLLQPLHHRDVAAGCDVRVGDPGDLAHIGADIVITQRHAVIGEADAAALVAACRAKGARLIFDLDDDLLDVPGDHPEAARLRPRMGAVGILAGGADDIWVSTDALAARMAGVGRRTTVIGNGLDENLWWPPPPDRPAALPLRLLYMGTSTHAADLATILPVLQRLLETLYLQYPPNTFPRIVRFYDF
jgi:hypothetical protein